MRESHAQRSSMSVPSMADRSRVCCVLVAVVCADRSPRVTSHRSSDSTDTHATSDPTETRKPSAAIDVAPASVIDNHAQTCADDGRCLDCSALADRTTDAIDPRQRESTTTLARQRAHEVRQQPNMRHDHPSISIPSAVSIDAAVRTSDSSCIDGTIFCCSARIAVDCCSIIIAYNHILSLNLLSRMHCK